MQLTYLGHSAFLLETSTHRIVFDPFLDQNPSSPVKAADLRCDYVIVSHGHEDHCADALALAQRHGAAIIANYEISEHYAKLGAKTHGLNPGGAHGFPFGRVKLTPAIHTSSTEIGGGRRYMGIACGVLLSADGKHLYHAGDTALFSDMALIARAGLDLALLPIGDNYTMGPDDALLALDYLRPKLAVPMHYNTWPIIAQDAAAFAARAATAGHTVRVLRPGETLGF
ncbi:MAG: metal-dependent hydrolase [Opitutus sp.]|nr:metal-dependent hydrolase [Opitutus sp.]